MSKGLVNHLGISTEVWVWMAQVAAGGPEPGSATQRRFLTYLDQLMGPEHRI